MQKTSITAIALVIVLSCLCVVALAGGLPTEKEVVNKADQTTTIAPGAGATKTGGAPVFEQATTPAGDIFELRGTIVRKEMEGGFFAIDGDNGITYDPVNLPESYKKDGLKVKVEARLKSDVMSIHMVGPTIEILNIAKQ